MERVEGWQAQQRTHSLNYGRGGVSHANPGSGRVHKQVVERRVLLWLGKASPQPLGWFSPAPLSSLDSSVLTFVFPFGFFLSLQVSVVN